MILLLILKYWTIALLVLMPISAGVALRDAEDKRKRTIDLIVLTASIPPAIYALHLCGLF
ncbi:MAG TPA: hypothetical protein VMY37_16310 [Thermoguttaceae bacterium]|nr:hypothetical protein [Thermoguttaceae bacterium]